MYYYPSAVPTPSFSYKTAPYSAPSLRFRDAFSSAKQSGRPAKPALFGPSNHLSASTRAFLRNMFDDDAALALPARRSTRERTRDDLIDSVIHTRTPENRVMPGFFEATNWDERHSMSIDCDKVYPGIYLCNGETVQNLDYLKSVGVTHVLNTAERHVPVNPAKYPLHNISYYGFHVDDHPSANISRYFTRCCEFIDDALSRGGVIAVNCAMGWSRSAVIVAAYLVAKKGMTSTQAVEHIRQHRPIRPNPGFLQQLASYDTMLGKRLVWDQ